MKRISSLLLLGLALVLSCTKEGPTGVNKIDGLYTIPEGAIEMGQLTGAESTWSTDRRYFDLSFGGANATVVTTLVGYDALLASGQYLLGADEIGKAVLAETKVNGKAVKEGFFSVNERDGKYTITAQLDGTLYAWKGTLPFEPDPDPVELSVVMEAKANNGILTMNLATPGIEKSYNDQWQEVWTGEGGYLALDINTGSNYLADGNYVACAEGGVVNPGEFGIGWDPGDLYGIGMIFTDWGTCWWDVKDGAATATKIVDGLVTVSSREEKVDDKDVVIWTIYWGVDYPMEFVFEGQIPALTKPKTPSGPTSFDYTYTIGEPSACILNDNTTVVEGVKKYPFTISDAAGEEVAYLEFVLVDGATDVTPGDYVSTEYAHEVGQLANGYFFDMGDWGTFGGGSYYVSGGQKVYIDPGVTVTVTQVATGAFEFSSDGFDFAAAGPNYVPGGDVADALPAVDEITDNGNGVDKHSITIGGDTVVAYFELLTATGADIEGSFVSTEYAAEAGMLCNGWEFPDWGIGGGSYVMKGEVKEYVAPGVTVEVTKLADSIYKFTGPDYEFVANISK